jgi:hypothetical protein
MENLDNQNLEVQNEEQTTAPEFHSRIDMTELAKVLPK